VLQIGFIRWGLVWVRLRAARFGGAAIAARLPGRSAEGRGL